MENIPFPTITIVACVFVVAVSQKRSLFTKFPLSNGSIRHSVFPVYTYISRMSKMLCNIGEVENSWMPNFVGTEYAEEGFQFTDLNAVY
jgi:hypothetical protein